MLCKATDCQNQAVVSGLCDEHFQEWRTALDNWKNTKELKTDLEKKYDLPHEPIFTNLEDFK